MMRNRDIGTHTPICKNYTENDEPTQNGYLCWLKDKSSLTKQQTTISLFGKVFSDEFSNSATSSFYLSLASSKVLLTHTNWKTDLLCLFFFLIPLSLFCYFFLRSQFTKKKERKPKTLKKDSAAQFIIILKRSVLYIQSS